MRVMPDTDLTTDRNTAVLEAAEEVFALHGYRRVSMDDIALAVGLSRAGLYKRFANKKALFRAAVSRLHEGTLVEVAKITRDAPDDAKTLDLVIAAFEARIGYLMDRRWDSPCGMEILEESHRICGDIVSDTSNRFRKEIAILLDRANARGEIKLKAAGLNAHDAADLISAAVNGLKLASPGPTEFRDSMRRVIRLLFTGMA